MPRLALALSLCFPLAVACTVGAEAGADEADTSEADEASEGSTEPPDEWDELVEPLAGTRLRPIMRTGDDGTRVQVGWYDGELDTPCVFDETPAGELRCLPTTGGNDVWLYADASCTQPALQDIWIPVDAKVLRERGDACFDARYWQVGEAVPELYYDANGPCELFSNDPAHRVIALQAADFVAATLEPAPGTSRIVPLVLTAEDGARQIYGAWDREHDEEVEPSHEAAEQLRWVGRWQPRVATGYFADPACSEPVALRECVPPSRQPTSAAETTPGFCPQALGRRALLGEVEQVYVQVGEDCAPTELYSSRAWRVGEVLDEAAFAVASSVDGGAERLRHDVYANPEGEPFLASGRVYDRELGEHECRFRTPDTYRNEPSPSASFECVPTDAASLSGRYLDASCTSEVASRWVFEESCYGPAEYAYGDGEVVAISGGAGPGGFVLDDQDACVASQYVPPDGDGMGEFYAVESERIAAAHATDVIE